MSAPVKLARCFVAASALFVAGCASGAGPKSPTALSVQPTTVAASTQSAGTRAPAAASSAVAGDEDAMLAAFARRPLQLPKLQPDGSCPTSGWHLVERLLPDEKQWAGYFAFGDGPIYAIVYGTETTGHLDISQLQGGSVKTRWLAGSDYQQPALVRGGQIGESAPIRFVVGGNNPSIPTLALRTGADDSAMSEPGWRTQQATIEVTDPGCYAFQVDGVNLLEFVVFEVTG